MRRPQELRGDGAAGFGPVSRDERRRADLFFDDLVRRPGPSLLRSPGDRALLRTPPPIEHVTSGAAVLRPGLVGPPVDGTQGVAHLAIVSPSGASPGNQAASINPIARTWRNEFGALGHQVAFDFAPNEPSPSFTDEAAFPLAGTDLQRWEALRTGLFDAGTSAAVATRGGHGATRLLDELSAFIALVMAQQRAVRRDDLPRIHEVLRPKRIVGFSDFTAVLLAVYSRLGWASLHGPMLCCGNQADRARLIRALTVAPGALDARNEVAGNLTLVGPVPGRNSVDGVLLGGNLALVDALYGSPFFPSLQGGLLFVEETNELGRKIDRMIEGLKQRGAAAQARAVVVGQVVGRDSITARAMATLFQRSWNVPVVFGLQAGHGAPNRTIWIGLRYELEFRGNGGASLFLRP